MGTPLAIKMLDPFLAQNRGYVARFKQEARSAGALRSPHVVQIFDYGIWHEMPFITMELLKGESLGTRLDRVVRLTPTATATIVTQTSRALIRAHRLGIIHRDVKPDNIFLCTDDEGENEIVKILDFGIAKEVDGGTNSTGTDIIRTGTAVVLGTPYYMSPEQAHGVRHLDYRTDIWSLGVVTFEAMVGRRPFEAKNIGSLLVKICEDELPVASDLASDVPLGFDEWFFRACARNPDERFSSVKEMTLSLNAICDLAPTMPALSYLVSASASKRDSSNLKDTEVKAVDIRDSAFSSTQASEFDHGHSGAGTLRTPGQSAKKVHSPTAVTMDPPGKSAGIIDDENDEHLEVFKTAEVAAFIADQQLARQAKTGETHRQGEPSSVRRTIDRTARFWKRNKVLVPDVAVFLLSAVLILSLAAAIGGRIAFPYSLEWNEGAMAENVARVLLAGEKLYVQPTIEYVPFSDPPMYYWVSAALSRLIGPGMLPLRVVSVLATIGSIVCIMALVRRECGRWLPSIAAAALFAGTFAVSGSYFDIGGVVPLATCFLLWSAYALKNGSGVISVVGAAVLLVLSSLTMQLSVLVAISMGVYLFVSSRRMAYWFVGVFVVLLASACLVMNFVYDGWFWYYVYDVWAGGMKAWGAILPFVTNDVLVPFGLALTVSYWPFLSKSSSSVTHARMYYGMLFAGVLLMALLGQLQVGGTRALLMPFHAGVAVVFGLGMGAAFADLHWDGPRVTRFVTLMVVIQLVGLLWNPVGSMPTREDRNAAHTWVEKVGMVPGAVWVTHRVDMAGYAGKGGFAHLNAISAVIESGSDFRGAKTMLGLEVVKVIESHAFSAVVLDRLDPWLVFALDVDYRRDRENWVFEDDVLWTRAGVRVRPQYGFVVR